MANTSGEKELKTDYPEQDTEPYNLVAEEVITDGVTDGWGSL